MKIPNELEEFRGKNILMLIAGKQNAVLYHIYHNNIDEVFSFVTPKPEYSDNKARYQFSSNGRLMSDNIEGYRDEDMIRDFLRDLNEKIEEIKFDFDEVFLLAPGSSRSKIKEHLPRVWQDKISKIEEGNYFKESPLEILEKISKKEEKVFEPITNEEKKIMSIPKIK